MLEQHLRHLRGFAGAGRRGNNRAPVLFQPRDDIRFDFVNGQPVSHALPILAGKGSQRRKEFGCENCAVALRKAMKDYFVHFVPANRLNRWQLMDSLANRLVDSARCGDNAAAVQFIELFYERIYAFLRRLAGNDADAANLTQRTFSRAWQALPTFAGRSSVASWIHSIAYHVYVDWRRADRRSSRVLTSGGRLVRGRADAG